MARTPQPFAVAMAQMDVGPDRADNLARAEALVRRAARRKADIVCLPELFSYMGHFSHPRRVAETPCGPSLTMLRRCARELSLSIVGGSILIQRPRGNPFNTTFFIGPDGRILARYSKLHLFDIEVPGKIRFLESRFLHPGTHATVAATPFGTVGFAICNDLRYPELFRRMALAGARIVFLPAAFTKFTGRDHWLALTRVRAIENQCYVVAVNQSGQNASGVRFFGSSVAVDPWGTILAEGPAKGDRLVVCEIDPRRVETIRRQLPALTKIRRTIPLKRMGG